MDLSPRTGPSAPTRLHDEHRLSSLIVTRERGAVPGGCFSYSQRRVYVGLSVLEAGVAAFGGAMSSCAWRSHLALSSFRCFATKFATIGSARPERPDPR